AVVSAPRKGARGRHSSTTRMCRCSRSSAPARASYFRGRGAAIAPLFSAPSRTPSNAPASWPCCPTSANNSTSLVLDNIEPEVGRRVDRLRARCAAAGEPAPAASVLRDGTPAVGVDRSFLFRRASGTPPPAPLPETERGSSILSPPLRFGEGAGG